MLLEIAYHTPTKVTDELMEVFMRYKSVAAALAAITLALSTSSVARADLTLYAEKNYKVSFPGTYSRTVAYFGDEWNDTLSSLINPTNEDASFFDHRDRRGGCFTQKRHTRNSGLPVWDNDNRSSMRFGAAC